MLLLLWQILFTFVHIIITITIIIIIINNNNSFSISPIDNPFGYLWLANCVLYSTVAAFLLLKGWKKPRAQGEPRKNGSDRSKKVFEELAVELRKNISMAKAELERLRENRKLTKKTKRNRTLLFEVI